MLDLAYQRWGRLDVLFNNAGIAEVRQLLDVTEDDWDRMLAVNLRAVFFVLQGAAKRMRHQSPIAGSELRGKLIQTASIAAYRGGLANMAHYAASKAGVVSITRTAAQVLAADRILNDDLTPKMLEFQRMIVPKAKVVATLFNPVNPTNPPMLDNLRAQAGAMGMSVLPVVLQPPEGLAAAFSMLASEQPDALHLLAIVWLLKLTSRV
jgi:NAD(P)-dependent dehydrogenase (short-subunit alcohol dehydrogenase family)